MVVADFGGCVQGKISDFLLRSEYIGKTGIFQQVRTFVEDVKARVASGELKGLAGGGVVNSAANQTFFKRRKWRDVIYTVNCLTPALYCGFLTPLLSI